MSQMDSFLFKFYIDAPHFCLDTCRAMYLCAFDRRDLGALFEVYKTFVASLEKNLWLLKVSTNYFFCDKIRVISKLFSSPTPIMSKISVFLFKFYIDASHFCLVIFRTIHWCAFARRDLGVLVEPYKTFVARLEKNVWLLRVSTNYFFCDKITVISTLFPSPKRIMSKISVILSQ